MPIDPGKARDLARHESDVLATWRAGRRRDDLSVQPPSPGSGNATPWRLVRVRQVGGAAGSFSSRCSWIYDIFPLTGAMDMSTRIAAGVSTVYGRWDAGAYRAAEDGTPAVAWLRPDPADPANSEWVLLTVCDEVFTPNNCDGAP